MPKNPLDSLATPPAPAAARGSGYKPKPDYGNWLTNAIANLIPGGEKLLVSEAQLALRRGAAMGDQDHRPIRHAQTKQFQNPKQDVLPKSTYKPTALTKYQDRDFRSQAQYFPEYIQISDPQIGGLSVDTLKEGPLKLDHKKVHPAGRNDPAVDMAKNWLESNPRLEAYLGLGNGTMSLGYDHERAQPYLSVFDSWDFETGPDNGEIHGGYGILRSQGKPFNIYDRVYFKPTHYGGIPDFISTQDLRQSPVVGDIELKPSVKALKELK